MINSLKLLNCLINNNINFFCGVPDSILKFFTQEVVKNKKVKNITTPNEGSSIALAAGYYLSKKKLACVYMQNSGLGNAINPLSSITHKKVYSIPMLLLIGWRGATGTLDEPQHRVKGSITKEILKLLKIKYIVLNSKNFSSLKKLINYSKKNSVPVACLFKNSVFEKNKNRIKKNFKLGIKRIDFIKILLKYVKTNSKIISTTGYTSRELYQIRKQNSFKKGKDFYMVGGMGHASMLTLGVSLNDKNNIICLDGDGSLLMHMGALNTIGKFANKNFKHIIFDNQTHESVGEQRTYSENINFKKLIESMKYKYYKKINNKNDINKELIKFLKSKGPSLLNVETSNGSLKNLIRPQNLIKIKNDFKN